MAVLLRILLILIPIMALFLWLRWRVKRDLDEETREIEFRRLRAGFVALVVALFAVGLGIRFLDETSGDVDQVYVPARVENGVLIPGRFVSKDEAEAQSSAPEQETEKEDPPSGGGDGAD